MADTLIRRVLLRITADDGDTEHKLDAIGRKADELAARHPELKVRIDTAAASAKMAVLRKELRSLDDTGGGKGGILGKALFGGAEALPGGGTLGMLAAAVPLVEALAVEAAGLASGLAAAGIGVGAFAALALPAFKKVTTGYQAISLAQKNYQTAVFNEKTDPTKAHLAAVSAALLKVKDAWHQMDPAERAAVRNLQGFTGEYHKMAKAFEPDAFRVFNQGLRVANKLLPDLKPFADTAATAIDGLLKKLGQAVTPATPSRDTGFLARRGIAAPPLTGWQQFIAQVKQLEGPALTAIGAGFGKIGVALGHLLTIMSKKDVVHSINIAFDVLAGTIDGVSFVIRRLMFNWDKDSAFIAGRAHFVENSFDHMRHVIAAVGHGIASDFDQVRHSAADLAHNTASYFDESRANVARWAGDVGRDTGRVVGWFRALPGRIVSAVSGFGRLLWNAGASLLQGLIGGIKSMIGSVIGTVTGVGKSILGSITGALGIGSPSRITFQHGRWLAEGLARGMTAGGPDVARAAARMAASAVPGPGAYSRAGGRGYGGPDEWVIHLNMSEHQLMEFLHQGLVRVKRRKGFPADTRRGLGLA